MYKFYWIVLFTIAILSCKEESHSTEPMTIGVFGGSQSVAYVSKPTKDKWSKEFNATVTDYGIPGAGFSSVTENNIPQQIAKAPACDVYILWASTNDAAALNIDEDNENNLATQSGGLKHSLELIKQKNIGAIIVLFTSFYTPHSRICKKLPVFVQKQIEFCEKYKVPCLDQFKINFPDPSYFLEDGLHLSSAEGYALLEPFQTEFLRKYILLK